MEFQVMALLITLIMARQFNFQLLYISCTSAVAKRQESNFLYQLSWILNIKKSLGKTNIVFCLHSKISAHCSLNVSD